MNKNVYHFVDDGKKRYPYTGEVMRDTGAVYLTEEDIYEIIRKAFSKRFGITKVEEFIEQLKNSKDGNKNND